MPRPPCSRYGTWRRGIVEVLRDPDAEQVIGVEVGAVQRVDVGAKRSADARGQRVPSRDRGDLGELVAQRREALASRSSPRPCSWRSSRRPCAPRSRRASLAAASSSSCVRSLRAIDQDADRRRSCCGRPGSRSSSASRHWRSGRNRRRARRRDPCRRRSMSWVAGTAAVFPAGVESGGRLPRQPTVTASAAASAMRTGRVITP